MISFRDLALQQLDELAPQDLKELVTLLADIEGSQDKDTIESFYQDAWWMIKVYNENLRK